LGFSKSQIYIINIIVQVVIYIRYVLVANMCTYFCGAWRWM